MRHATTDDLPALIEMGRKFHAAAEIKVTDAADITLYSDANVVLA